MNTAAKHTPGPWHATANGDAVVRNYERMGKEIPYPICELAASDTIGGIKSKKANALLIASAPDLLRATQVIALTPAITEWLDEHDPKALEQLRAALRKAGVA